MRSHETSVSLLTGGGDRPYVFGLVSALLEAGMMVDLIGSDELDFPEFRGKAEVNFFNLRGDQNPRVNLLSKILRILAYYVKLILYAARSKPRIFHILWNNKFEHFDRTLLMLYYKILGKKIAFTVHNVNAAKRDFRDSALNRLTLRAQYYLCDSIFVHTERMKRELMEEFGVHPSRVNVIPFGINNAVPHTALTRDDARRQLGVTATEKVILFFGNVTPYKGVEYLVSAFQKIRDEDDYRLVIAGKHDGFQSYLDSILKSVSSEVQRGRVVLRGEFIRDEDTEIYFKAADVLVLPYRHVYQSGVLFLAHSFGLPVIAANVGSLADDIVEGKTGLVFAPEDVDDLSRAIQRYFASDLYLHLSECRYDIRQYSLERHSWSIVADTTEKTYRTLTRTATERLESAAPEN